MRHWDICSSTRGETRAGEAAPEVEDVCKILRLCESPLHATTEAGGLESPLMMLSQSTPAESSSMCTKTLPKKNFFSSVHLVSLGSKKGLQLFKYQMEGGEHIIVKHGETNLYKNITYFFSFFLTA